jgi:hypothetical protein
VGPPRGCVSDTHHLGDGDRSGDATGCEAPTWQMLDSSALSPKRTMGAVTAQARCVTTCGVPASLACGRVCLGDTAAEVPTLTCVDSSSHTLHTQVALVRAPPSASHARAPCVHAAGRALRGSVQTVS